MLRKVTIAGMTMDPSSNTPIIILKSEEDERLPLGIFFQCEIPTYEDYLERKGHIDRAHPPAEREDIFHRDVTPLLDALT